MCVHSIRSPDRRFLCPYRKCSFSHQHPSRFLFSFNSISFAAVSSTVTTFHPARGNTTLSGPTGYRGEPVQRVHTSFPPVTFHLKMEDQPCHHRPSHRSDMQTGSRAHVHTCLEMLMICNCMIEAKLSIFSFTQLCGPR